MRAGRVVFDGTAAEADDAVFEQIYGRSLDATDVLPASADVRVAPRDAHPGPAPEDDA